jgi:DNA-binding CsgD family transcriptional regulator
VRHPFTDADVDAAPDLSEPLSQAVRRYQAGRPGTLPLPRRPGVVMVDGDDAPVAVTREAHAWLVDLADSWRYCATEDDVSGIVLEVARAARAGREPVCRVRMPRGEWLVVSGSRVEDTDCDVAVVLQAGDLGTVAPAFAAWCGLSPKESEVLHLVASGLAAKQIARRLGLSALTVNDHLKSVYRKAHVNSREELVSLL